MNDNHALFRHVGIEDRKINYCSEDILKACGMSREEAKEAGTPIEDVLMGISIPAELRARVIQVLACRDPNKNNEASEIMVEFIKKSMHIYTVRSDANSIVYIYKKGIYVPEGKTYIKEFVRIILGEAFTAFLSNSIIAKIEADTYIDASDFYDSSSQDEIAVANGVLNVRTCELSEFTPEKIFFNKIPVDYLPGARCPAIESHFDNVLKSAEDKTMIYEWFGYTLYKRQFIAKALMLSGGGRNGKSVTLNVWKAFLGPENVEHISLQDINEKPFITCTLLHKLANLAGEIPKDALKTTKMFKDITGGDRITVDVKFAPTIKFEPYVKMIFAANEIPISYDDTDAFWHRWEVIDFPFKFVSQKEYDAAEDKTNLRIANPDIEKLLTVESELSGLLNLALEGLERLLNNKDFSGNRTSKEIQDIWIRRSDSFKAFVKDEITEDYDGVIEKNELRRAYSIYCRENKVRTMSEKHIYFILSDMGVGDDREVVDEGSHKQVRVWKGIRFSRGSLGSHGFSLYREVTSSHIDLKRVTTLTALTTNNNTDNSPTTLSDEDFYPNDDDYNDEYNE